MKIHGRIIKNNVVIFLFLTLLLSPNFAHLFAATDATGGVAKVIILRGTVHATDKETQEKTLLKKGSWLKEGATVTSMAKSFTKLLFIDKSQMNLGPNSSMVIAKFSKTDTGIITLIQGKLRSKVTKDYLTKTTEDKSKLFVKTRTAAMGVRGTDFLTNFDQESQNTALVTFEGEVAMVKIDEDIDPEVLNNQATLEAMVTSDQAVLVEKGQFSGVGPQQPKASAPIDVSPAQLDSLKKADVTQATPAETKKAQAAVEAKKQFRNIVPPGMSAKAITGGGAAQAEKAIGDSLGKALAEKAIAQSNKNMSGTYVNLNSLNAVTIEVTKEGVTVVDTPTQAEKDQLEGRTPQGETPASSDVASTELASLMENIALPESLVEAVVDAVQAAEEQAAEELAPPETQGLETPDDLPPPPEDLPPPPEGDIPTEDLVTEDDLLDQEEEEQEAEEEIEETEEEDDTPPEDLFTNIDFIFYTE